MLGSIGAALAAGAALLPSLASLRASKNLGATLGNSLAGQRAVFAGEQRLGVLREGLIAAH